MLIALKADGRVYLAYNLRDLNVDDFDIEDYYLKDNLPVWKVKNGCIMGVDDSLADADLLRYDGRLFSGEINIYNMFENVLPKINEKLGAYNRLVDGEIKDAYIIAQGDRGYYFYGKNIVEELDEYFCVGNGYEQAMSVLDMTVGQPALERIKKAYLAVEKAEGVFAYPMVVMDTKMQKATIIERV